MTLYAVQDDQPAADGVEPITLEGFDELAGLGVRTLTDAPEGSIERLSLLVRCDDGQDRPGAWLDATGGITLVLPPEADELASVEAFLKDLHEVRCYERWADRLEERAMLLGQVVTWSAETVDRLVNYDGMDSGASELARLLRKRLSEVHLKLVMERAECGEWSRLWAGEADFDVADHPVRAEGSTPPRLAIAEALDDRRLGARFEEVHASLGETEVLLSAVRDLVSSMTDGAADRSADAMNAVLYWLGILTFFFGIVTVVDKYLSGDTFGLAEVEGLRWTLFAIVPMVLVFVLAMVRHGALLGWVGRAARGFRLRVADLLFGTLGWLAAGLKVRSTGPLWHEWLEWKTTTMLQVDLTAIGMEGTAGELARQQEAEDRVLEALGEILDDVQGKHARWTHVQAGRSVASQVRHLRTEALVGIAVAFILLEMPRWPSSLVAEILLQVRVPTIGIGHLPGRNLGEDGLRRLVGDFATTATCLSMRPPEVYRRVRRAAIRWLRGLDSARFVTDEEAWEFFAAALLLPGAGVDPDDPTIEAIEELFSDDIVAAFAALRYSELAEPLEQGSG